MMSAMFPFKGVLFDNDGTLVDTHDLIVESMRHATEEVLGRSLDDTVLAANIGRPLVVQMAEFSDDPKIQERLLESYRAYNESRHDERIKGFPGLEQCLRALVESGVALGVVTSKVHWLAAQGLDVLGLARYFRCLIGSDDCPRYKPDPLPVIVGVQALGLMPEECLYVGDSPFDIQAGNGAGTATVGVTWGTFPRDVLEAEDPTFIVDTPEQLLDVALHGARS